jgi:hypothetical protein
MARAAASRAINRIAPFRCAIATIGVRIVDAHGRALVPMGMRTSRRSIIALLAIVTACSQVDNEAGREATWAATGDPPVGAHGASSSAGPGGEGPATATGTGAGAGAGAAGGHGSGGQGGALPCALAHGEVTPSGACAKAATTASSAGCEFWLAPVTNAGIDESPPAGTFRAAIANDGSETATVVISGPGIHETFSIPGQSMEVVDLPVVHAFDHLETVTVECGAFHLESSEPVQVVQFSEGSHSSGASLLLPTSTLGTSYRVATTGDGNFAFLAVVATDDATTVTVTLAPTGSTVPGGTVPALNAGESVTIQLARGTVLQLGGQPFDPVGQSGTLVTSDKPVLVFGGSLCAYNPADMVFCDHMEEAMLPVERLGKSYFVVAPSSPEGATAAHSVTLVGAHEGTHLEYEPAPPPGAPLELSAGEAVSLGIVQSDFRVSADQPFLVATFLMSAEFLGTPNWIGDPSQTAPVPLEGFALTHTIHLLDDTTETWADVVAPLGAQVLVDGIAESDAPSAIGASGFGVHRLPLGPGDGGRHTIAADAPISVQVLQYANAVSVAYPASIQLQ